MPRLIRFCDVVACQNTSENCALAFFQVPGDPETYCLWTRSISLKPIVRKNHYICSAHFNDTCFTDAGFQFLTKSAFPTIQSNSSNQNPVHLPAKKVPVNASYFVAESSSKKTCHLDSSNPKSPTIQDPCTRIPEPDHMNAIHDDDGDDFAPSKTFTAGKVKKPQRCYKCSICPQAFSKVCNLYRHMRIIHKTEPKLIQVNNRTRSEETVQVVPIGRRQVAMDDNMLEELKLPDNYTYIHEDGPSRRIRVKEITGETEANVWLKKYSDTSKCTWRIRKTFPKSGRYNLLKLDLRCQHITDRRVKGVRRSKNTNCPARLLIQVQRCVAKSKVDPLVQEYPGFLQFTNYHNHAIDTAAALACRDVSEETKQKLYNLFKKGYLPSSALYFLKMDLMLEYGDDYYKIAADKSFAPSVSVVSKLFDKKFACEYGNMEGDKMLESLEHLLNDYNLRTSGKATMNKTDDGHYFVVLCTPLMLRVHETISQSEELVMVDAAGGMDKQRHRVYFFVTPTAAGGLPLGIIITDSETENLFTEALQCYKTLVGNIAFHSKLAPAIFLTDNDMKERSALKSIFPTSLTLLCQFHVLKAFWSWLCNVKHGIEKDERQEIYHLFKQLLYSTTTDDADKNLELLVTNVEFKGYYMLVLHVLDLWDLRDDWVSCFRMQLPTRGNNTTNYVEIVFRILKDCILQRVMAFNLTQLVDFLLTRYEMYMECRLTDFCNNRYSTALLKKMLLIEPDYKFSMKKISTDIYHVKSESDPQKFYVVDIPKGVCSCPVGACGKICKHSSAVLLSVEHEINSTYNLVGEKTKKDMFYVAKGSVPSTSWFRPLSQNIDCEVEPPLTASTTEAESPTKTLSKQASLLAKEGNDAETDTREKNKQNESTKDIPLTNEELEEIHEFTARIISGTKSDPNIYLPAARKFLKNKKRFATTETGFISALHTFATYSGVKSAGQRCAQKILRRCHKNYVGVQPTSIDRRIPKLPGKAKLGAGRHRGIPSWPTAVVLHNYTTMGRLPSRKKKAPHNLQQCVYDNKSLGGRRCAKTF